MSRAIWSSPAQRDLAELDRFYRERDPRAATRMAEAAVAAGRLLAANPLLGSPVPERRIRKWRVARTPYLIFYRPEGEGIRILRLLHHARDWQHQL